VKQIKCSQLSLDSKLTFLLPSCPSCGDPTKDPSRWDFSRCDALVPNIVSTYANKNNFVPTKCKSISKITSQQAIRSNNPQVIYLVPPLMDKSTNHNMLLAYPNLPKDFNTVSPSRLSSVWTPRHIAATFMKIPSTLSEGSQSLPSFVPKLWCISVGGIRMCAMWWTYMLLLVWALLGGPKLTPSPGKACFPECCHRLQPSYGTGLFQILNGLLSTSRVLRGTFAPPC
jgi:hypothetical protein